MIAIEPEDLERHIRRVYCERQFKQAVFGPDLRAHAESAQGQDTYVFAPPLLEPGQSVVPEAYGVPEMENLRSACQLARRSVHERLDLQLDGRVLVLSGDGERDGTSRTPVTEPSTCGAFISEDDRQDRKSTLEEGSTGTLRNSERDLLIRAHDAYGARQAILNVTPGGSRVRIGSEAAHHEEPLPAIRGDEDDGPYTVRVESVALRRVLNSVPDNVAAELVLTGPESDLGVRTEDGYVYGLSFQEEAGTS